MIQKTLITNSTQELSEYITKLKEQPEYLDAGEHILLFGDQNNDPEHLQQTVQMVREAMPGVKVVGTTMPKAGVMKEYGKDFVGAGYSFLLMERAKVDVFCYDCHEMAADEAGRQFRREIRYKENIAGIMIFSAGVEREIDRFLTMLAKVDRYEVPIVGAQAGADGTAYVCGGSQDGKPLDCGIMALVFYGRGLHMYYNYDMGWKAIGKEMRVTGTDGNYCVTSIDGMPATSIYREYLGVEPDEYFVENVREFPLITHRGERQVVRTPSGYDEEGNLYFIARVNEGDRVMLSYGNPRRLLEETKVYADSMRAFAPQALFLVICENRARFLGEMAASDIMSYRGFMPQLAWVRGFSAMMLDKSGGGVVNSAIVSVGMREGAARGDDLDRPAVLPPQILQKGATPLEQRLAMFLEKTTKELEEMAVQADAANAAKSEFLSQMSHEIRTPINAVLGMNEMILRESKDENVLRYAENARVAGLSLLGIISDILDFSKIEAGRMDIVPCEYELSSLINDLVNLISHRVEEKGLQLVVSVNPTTPRLLFGDEIRIKQIITNLLTNAAKYTEKGSVRFLIDYQKTAQDEITLFVSVQDTGIGIRQENIHKLFQAFDRIDKNRARQIEGTGLGINITQQLLHLMGSGLKVESTYGEGSTFSFSLVQKVTNWDGIGNYKDAIGQVKKKRVERKAQFTAENARILVVDDAPMNLDVISGLLRRTLIKVDTADSGAACIERFGQNTYDLVFLDHRMPNMDGIETLQRMKELYGEDLRGVPVISLTANAVAGAREQYIEAGFVDYLTKPVIPHELEAMLQKHLPEEKVLFRVPEEEEPAGPKLPLWLEEVPLLDVEQGVEFCGGVKEYLDALGIFAKSIRQRADEIEDCYRRRDWENYTIKVHALKSMTKSIGAASLSELAAELEDAGIREEETAILAGTEVLLSLYRDLAQPLSRLEPLAAEIKVSGNENARHILLVDDDEDFLALVSRWLKKEYRVSAIHSGEQALEYLQTVRPDLILLDYAMPGMSGLDVLREIRRNPETQNLSVLFLTGTEDREIVKNAEQLRPEGYLLKSVGKSGLLMGVSRFFD